MPSCYGMYLEGEGMWVWVFYSFQTYADTYTYTHTLIYEKSLKNVFHLKLS
jgi:hypothetical protein